MIDVPEFLHGRMSEIVTMKSDAAHKRRLWAVVLGLKPFIDGDKWCLLWGANIQEGVVAFGSTPCEVVDNFESAMYAALRQKGLDDLAKTHTEKRDAPNGLSVLNKEDGVWLHFKSSSGKEALFHISNFTKGRKNNIVDQTIEEWAADVVKAVPLVEPEKDVWDSHRKAKECLERMKGDLCRHDNAVAMDRCPMGTV